MAATRTEPHVQPNPSRNRRHWRRQGQAGRCGAAAAGGIVAFYYLGKQDLWVRVLALLALLGAAVALFFTSESGKQLIAFGRDSVREVKKVVWPTRKEAMQMTGYVFAFVFVMALFMWITDKTLEWALYDLILGWRS
jgi:preprotein translocase subunit SecE